MPGIGPDGFLIGNEGVGDGSVLGGNHQMNYCIIFKAPFSKLSRTVLNICRCLAFTSLSYSSPMPRLGVDFVFHVDVWNLAHRINSQNKGHATTVMRPKTPFDPKILYCKSCN